MFSANIMHKDFQFLFKIGYHLLICPFRVSSKGNHIVFQESQVRKVVCGSLQALNLLLYITLFVYPNAKLGLRKGNPRFLFDIIVTLSVLGYIYSAMYSIWCRRKDLSQLTELETMETLGENKSNNRLLKFLLLLGFMNPLTNVLFPNPPRLLGLTRELLGCPNPRNATIYSSAPLVGWYELLSMGSGREECNEVVMKVCIALHFFGSSYFYISWGFSNAMILNCSAALYRFGENLHGLVKLRECRFKIRHEYVFTKQRIELINRVVSITNFFQTVEFAMFVSLTLPSVLMSAPIVVVGKNLVATFANLGSMLLAAEGYRLIEGVERFLIWSFPLDAANTALTLRSAPGDCGLKVWHVSTISYAFVGSLGTAVFTYALVVMQLPN